MANSTMMGIMARTAGYTGQEITWEEAFNSDKPLGPNVEDYAWDYEYAMPAIAIPGKTKPM